MHQRISYANVVSTLALVLAIGGGAYAAVDVFLPRNSVGAKQIAKGAVRSAEAKNLAVGDLAFSLGLGVAERTDVLSPTADVFTTVLSDTVVTQRDAPMAVADSIEVKDFGQAVAPTDLQARVVINGQPEELAFDAEVAQNATETVSVLIPCDLMPAGTYTIELQVALDQAGSTIVDRSMEVLTLPAEAEPPPSP